jgi:Holliday junction resolvasome RuvABC DNA-binding subunit
MNTTTTQATFSMTRFQDALIAKCQDIDANGVGGHKDRSKGRARANAVKALVGMGFELQAARDAVQEAWDVYQLQAYAD